MSRLDAIGADRAMAQNSVNYSGYSGMLRNQYVDITGICLIGRSLGLQDAARVWCWV